MKRPEVFEHEMALGALQYASEAFPYLRIGQLLSNACGNVDLFYAPDREIAARLREFVATHKGEQ
jgi:hypothetical protein